MVDSLLGGSDIKYVGHRASVHKASLATGRAKMRVNLGELDRHKELAGGQESNCLHRATMNGAWLIAVPHRLNGTELSQEEFRDNLCLRYGLMPQDILATCDGCVKKFLIEHALSCPKGGLVFVWHDNATKEWGNLGARALVPCTVLLLILGS